MGEKNYITPSGFRKLQEEFDHLKFTERREIVQTVAWAASNGDRSENADYQYGKRRLREIDRRLEYLTKRLENSEIIDPAGVDSAITDPLKLSLGVDGLIRVAWNLILIGQLHRLALTLHRQP